MIKRYGGVAWRKWVAFAQILGTINLTILLTIIYWTLLLVIAVPYKVLADPLELRKRNREPVWHQRSLMDDLADTMTRQG